MPSGWRAVIGPATSRQFGFRTRDPRRCATWCGRASGAKQDQLRARHRLGKFLLRMGSRPAVGMKAWTPPTWLGAAGSLLHSWHARPRMLDYLYEVDHPWASGSAAGAVHHGSSEAGYARSAGGGQGLAGFARIAEISAVTIVAELGSITRFENARHLMVTAAHGPSEDSSGQRTRRGKHYKNGQRASQAHRC